jgi:hypothetical protein
VPEELAKVHEAVEGRSTVEELGRVTGLGEFETTRSLYGLVQTHHVTIHPPRVSGGPTALVSAANGALRAVFEAAAQGGKADEIREGLASFAIGAGVYDILFRRAGPDATGALDPDKVAENAVIVAGGADTDNILKQMLHEYVSFALFSVGAALGSDVESSVTKAVTPLLLTLRPAG